MLLLMARLQKLLTDIAEWGFFQIYYHSNCIRIIPDSSRFFSYPFEFSETQCIENLGVVWGLHFRNIFEFAMRIIRIYKYEI